MLLKRIVIGVLGIAAGLLLIKFREKFQRITGQIGFAEKYLGAGGTFTFFLLLGSLAVILAVLYIFGVLDGLVARVFGPLFG